MAGFGRAMAGFVAFVEVRRMEEKNREKKLWLTKNPAKVVVVGNCTRLSAH
jgi:hypothetical protein